jgi:hypothetical protein
MDNILEKMNTGLLIFKKVSNVLINESPLKTDRSLVYKS